MGYHCDHKYSEPMATCNVCEMETTCECREFKYLRWRVCAMCDKYITSCIAKTNDRVIACPYLDDPNAGYSPFVIIPAYASIVVTFTEERAIEWCNSTCASPSRESPHLRYKSALIYHMWLYVNTMLAFQAEIRNIIINLALRDNGLGVD